MEINAIGRLVFVVLLIVFPLTTTYLVYVKVWSLAKRHNRTALFWGLLGIPFLIPLSAAFGLALDCCEYRPALAVDLHVYLYRLLSWLVFGGGILFSLFRLRRQPTTSVLVCMGLTILVVWPTFGRFVVRGLESPWFCYTARSGLRTLGQSMLLLAFLVGRRETQQSA